MNFHAFDQRGVRSATNYPSGTTRTAGAIFDGSHK
jgi:hypothetical protein